MGDGGRDFGTEGLEFINNIFAGTGKLPGNNKGEALEFEGGFYSFDGDMV